MRHDDSPAAVTEQGADAWSIAPDASVYDTVRLMAEKKLGALMVVDGDRLVDIISERGYAREIVLKDRWSRNTPVSAIMTRNVLFVRPDRPQTHAWR